MVYASLRCQESGFVRKLRPAIISKFRYYFSIELSWKRVLQKRIFPVDNVTFLTYSNICKENDVFLNISLLVYDFVSFYKDVDFVVQEFDFSTEMNRYLENAISNIAKQQ